MCTPTTQPRSFYLPTSKMKVSCLILFLGISGCYGHDVGRTIKTSSGPVSGRAATVESHVSTYLGIPYAQPPVGNLRFMPPQKYHGDKLINGSSIVSFFLYPSIIKNIFTFPP